MSDQKTKWMELNANLAVLFLVVVVCVLYCAVCGDSIKYQNELFYVCF